MKRRIYQSGFTLIELIIALLILSMVIVLCGSGFRFGTRVWNSVDVQAGHIDNVQAVQNFVRTSVSNALVHDRFLDEEDEEELANLFAGDSGRISYVSYSPAYGVDDFLYQYNLHFDPKKKQLALRFHPFNRAQNNSSASTAALVEGVKGVRIEYFSGYIDDLTDNQGWSPYWNRDFSLPLLVKIQLILEDKQQAWPELVIQMRNGPYVIR